MATSITNRQYLESSGITHTFKPGPPTQHACSSNNSNNNKSIKSNNNTIQTQVFHNYSSDSDDDDNIIINQEHALAIKEAKAELAPPVHDPRDEQTADCWVERNPALVRLTGKHPFNAEPPLTQLMRHGFITPVPLHYVRNHGPVPEAVYDEWTVEVTGLVKRPTRLTMHQLETEFPSRELPVTLVCAANRRKEQNMVKQTIGFNWGAAGISTSLWRGVPLHLILRRCGIMKKSNGALNVCFEGSEDLPGGGGGGCSSKYGTSLKKEIAMDPSRDIMLAYMQNGERLTPDHGFPVRMIIPGFTGGRMVKWLKRIVVTTHESDSYYHYRDNKILPSHVDAELANAEAWWYKPEYIINELNVNSAITTPCHDEILPINSRTTQRPYMLRGYAYSGGGKKVTRVEVTMNGGETWSVCDLNHQEKPNKYGKYWCWCFWSLQVEVLDLLAAKEIAVRAWDETLNTQPEKLIWNLMGMINNCWFRVKTKVCKTYKGEIAMAFEHPTQPGDEPGGWMARERRLELPGAEARAPKKSVSLPFMKAPLETFSLSEVKKHGLPDSAWIVVHGHVYDCTRFLKDHPGGSDSILINAGTDCTVEFDSIHSDEAKKMLEGYRIGEMIKTGNESADSSPNSSVQGMNPIALIPCEKIACKLISKNSLSHDVRLFRFTLPRRDQVLGLPVGKHIFLCANIDGKMCIRSYTPSTNVDAVGYFELVVKIYFKNAHPKFPDGGLMTQYLDNLNIGSTVNVKGPFGHIEYRGRGNFVVHGKPKFARKLAMIAGGSGITPIYQVVQAILKDPEDLTEMYVVYANRTEDDILLRDEFDDWARKYPDRVRVWYVVQESVRGRWSYGLGFITEDVLRQHIPAATDNVLALACGPPPMLQFTVNPCLEKMGYDVKESLLVF